MRYLSLQEVQIMHGDIINEIGGLSGANPIADGNKRTKLNRPASLPTDFYQRLEDVIVSVASDELSKDELAQILSAMLKGIQ